MIIFAVTFLCAFLGVLPPGLVNMTVIKTFFERGRNSALLVGFGACVIVFFQALVGIHLSRLIAKHQWMYSAMFQVGLVLFLILAIYFFIQAKKRASQKTIKISKHGFWQNFLKGALLSLLNVLPIPFFCALAVTLHIRMGLEYNYQVHFNYALAASLGSFLMLCSYIFFFSFLKISQEQFARRSNYLMAMLMLFLSLFTLTRIVVG